MLNLYVKMQMVRSLAGERLNREEGAAAIEYGLIAGLIAVAIIAGATIMGGALDNIFQTIGGVLDGVSASL